MKFLSCKWWNWNGFKSHFTYRLKRLNGKSKRVTNKETEREKKRPLPKMALVKIANWPVCKPLIMELCSFSPFIPLIMYSVDVLRCDRWCFVAKCIFFFIRVLRRFSSPHSVLWSNFLQDYGAHYLIQCDIPLAIFGHLNTNKPHTHAHIQMQKHAKHWNGLWMRWTFGWSVNEAKRN